MPDDPKKRPKKVTEGYLERAALHYLGRFASTEANLIQVLERKIRRRNEENTAPTAEQMGWIANAAAKCVRLGYVDDAHYAKQRFASLLRKGKPLRTISQDLRYKGVADHLVTELIAQEQADPEVDLDLSAAAAYARRRRFGPFRRADRMTEEKIEKEKAAMLRTGFSFQVVKRVLDSSEEDLLQLLP